MKKGSAGAVWGMLMIVGGILLAGKILHWFEFEFFFAGWWTLFLIIPSAVNFMTGQKDRSRALKGLIIGVMLLMAAQGFIEYRMLFPLLIAAFLILSGCRMMFSNGKNPQDKKSFKQGEFSKNWEEQDKRAHRNKTYHGEKKHDHGRRMGAQEVHDWRREADRDQFEDASNYSFEEEYDYYEEPSDTFAWNDYANREEYRKENYSSSSSFFAGGANHNGRCACTSIFMGKEINYTGEVFEGAVLSCIMGAIDLNLSGAIIYHDVTIEVILIMGGIDIIVPKDVRVVVQGGPTLGSVDNHVRNRPAGASAPTVYVKTTCILGGMDIV